MPKTTTVVHGHVTLAHVVMATLPLSVPKARPRVKEVGVVADRRANGGAFPFCGDSGVIPVTQVSGVAEIVVTFMQLHPIL